MKGDAADLAVYAKSSSSSLLWIVVLLSARNMLWRLWLQLHEMDLDVTSKLTNCDSFCDVICLLYDITNPHTFDYCAQLYKVLSLCN